MTAAADELELKAVVPDLAALRARLAAVAVPGWRGVMRDVRLDRGGELAARDEVLRLRSYGPDDWRLAWKGPASVTPEGYKHRAELECAGAGDAGAATEVFARVGFSAVHRIDRWIEQCRVGDATVRIEVYPRMDVLVEIEGEPAAMERAIEVTGIPREAFTAEALDDFVARYEAREGRRAAVSEAEFGQGTLPWAEFVP